jgi:hypothetical protein
MISSLADPTHSEWLVMSTIPFIILLMAVRKGGI